MVSANLDGYFLVKPIEEIEQLVRGKATKMSVHQVRYFGLGNSEHAGYFALFELLGFENLKDKNADFRAGEQLVGIFQSQISEDIPRTRLKFNVILGFLHVRAPGLPYIFS